MLIKFFSEEKNRSVENYYLGWFLSVGVVHVNSDSLVVHLVNSNVQNSLQNVLMSIHRFLRGIESRIQILQLLLQIQLHLILRIA